MHMSPWERRFAVWTSFSKAYPFRCDVVLASPTSVESSRADLEFAAGVR
jgi:hypothetical protein